MSIRSLALLPFLSLLAPLTAQTVVFQSHFEGAMPSAISPGTAALEAVQGFAGLGPTGDQFGGPDFNAFGVATSNGVRVQVGQ